jgi:hypothetical protein
MEPRNQPRVRLRIDELECRAVPAVLTPVEVPGPTALLGDHAQIRSVQSAPAHSPARPFHLEESGAAVFNPDGTISGSASGQATHLGRFTLHDTATIVGVEETSDGLILHLVGEAERVELVAANGDKLYASFTGSVNLTTGSGTLTFEWAGGDGRFADATGTTLWQFTVNPDLSYTAVADGVISY